jgi:hypothetical protein
MTIAEMTTIQGFLEEKLYTDKEARPLLLKVEISNGERQWQQLEWGLSEGGPGFPLTPALGAR